MPMGEMAGERGASELAVRSLAPQSGKLHGKSTQRSSTQQGPCDLLTHTGPAAWEEHSGKELRKSTWKGRTLEGALRGSTPDGQNRGCRQQAWV